MDPNFWAEFGMNMANAVAGVMVWALPVLVTALVGLVVQFIRVQQAKLKGMYPSQYEMLGKVAATAVKIAEQLGVKNLIENKKQWAIDYVQVEVNKLGLEVSMEEIANIIEKALFDEITVKYDAEKLLSDASRVVIKDI